MFWKKQNNNYCEIFLCKNAICLFTNPFLATICGLDILAAGWLDYGFVINNKQMAFLQSSDSQQLPIVFIFKTSGYNVDPTGCVSGQTDLWF